MIKKLFKEKHERSVVKAITWRVIASLTTAILVYIFTGSFTLTLGVSVFEISLKMLFYYIHERAWNSVRWGKEAKAKL